MCNEKVGGRMSDKTSDKNKQAIKTSDRLLSCPFCGGEAEILEHDNGWAIWHCIMCKNCKASQEWRKGYTKEEAITAWNTRKPMERILERLETEDMALFNAINKYQKKMYTDGDALDKVRMLQHKQLSNHKAIEIVKEEGEVK